MRTQIADLTLPRHYEGPLPVVVLIHGGFWRVPLTKVFLRPLMTALAAEGFAVWNIEYRRVGRGGGGGGVPATLEDVAVAIDHLELLSDLDLSRVIVCGHSAGGHLALWAAARPTLGDAGPGGPVRVPVAGALSLGGPVDLEDALESGIGRGAARAFLGGDDADLEANLEVAAPMRHLPLGVPQILIHGLSDTVVPPKMSKTYVARAVAAGDNATFIGLPGIDHLEVVNPHATPYHEVVAALRRLANGTT